MDPLYTQTGLDVDPRSEISSEARLPLESEERSRVEYTLQMSMQGTGCQAKISDIMAISNPHLNLRFQKRTRNLCIIESWVDVSKLDSENTLPNIIHKGFLVSNRGLLFANGAIDIPRNYDSNNVNQFILCQVGIGIPFVMQASELQDKTDRGLEVEIPEGFDCIFVHQGPININATEEEGQRVPKDIRQQRFLLRDPDLILPKYVLSCEIGASNGRKKEVCNACDSSSAVIFCQADNASLCENCDRSMHSSNKLLNKHKRIPISEKPITNFGMCIHHPDQTLTYYCHACQVPVCICCKMVGSHCSGDASTHKLTLIKEAYELALMTSNKSDLFMEERKKHISKDMAKLNKRLMAININAKESEAEILRKAEIAIKEVKEAVRQKINIILSEEVDLNRQMLQITWLEEFLKSQQTDLTPVEFLESWSRHVKFRTELHSAPVHSGVNRSKSVHPDLTVEGSFSIVAKWPQSNVQEEDDIDEQKKHKHSQEIWDDDVLKSEKSLRNNFLRDLDNTIISPRASSPTNSVSSVYSVAQSLAHSVSSGMAAPGGRSLKELIAVYESGQYDEEGRPPRASSIRRNSVERRSSYNFRMSDDTSSERSRLTQRMRMAVHSDLSLRTYTGNKPSSAKEWTDIWNSKSGMLSR